MAPEELPRQSQHGRAVGFQTNRPLHQDQISFERSIGETAQQILPARGNIFLPIADEGIAVEKIRVYEFG
jgi:hypothetical protein